MLRHADECRRQYGVIGGLGPPNCLRADSSSKSGSGTGTAFNRSVVLTGPRVDAEAEIFTSRIKLSGTSA